MRIEREIFLPKDLVDHCIKKYGFKVYWREHQIYLDTQDIKKSMREGECCGQKMMYEHRDYDKEKITNIWILATHEKKVIIQFSWYNNKKEFVDITDKSVDEVDLEIQKYYEPNTNN